MAINTLKYLESKTVDDLKQELNIVVALHPTLPLGIFNYHQIDSPKTHPVVRECRGLTLDLEAKQLVAKSFDRFFEWGEMAHEMPLFNFNNCFATSKEDGSLISLFNYRDKWFANTRGSFGNVPIGDDKPIWHDVILEALGLSNLQDVGLDPQYNYVFELCSPWNQVIRSYSKPTMYSLAAFKGMQEVNVDVPFPKPERFSFKNIDEVFAYLFDRSKDDPTFEGVVLCDDAFRRWKVKSPTWKALQQITGNNLHPRYFVAFAVYGGKEELLKRFPEHEKYVSQVEGIVKDKWDTLVKVWEDIKDIEDKKQFALGIKGRTEYSGLLFQLKMSGKKDLASLRSTFMSEHTIEKIASELKKRKI